MISFLTLYAGWRFIHSEKFSKEISIRASKVLTEKIGAKLDFTGVDFSLVPLSTTFKNIKILKKDPSLVDVELEADSLEVSFTYSSFIASELEIDEVSLRDGVVKLNINKKSEEDIVFKNLKTKEIYNKYIEALSAVPLRLNIFSLERVRLGVDGSSVYINSLSFSPHKRIARLKVDLSDVNIFDEELKKNLISFSKVKGLIAIERDEWRVDQLYVEKSGNEVNLRGVAFNENGFLNLNTNGSFSIKADEVLAEIPNISNDLKAIKAKVKGKIETSGIVDDPDAKISFVAEQADTPWIKLQQVSGVIDKRKHILNLQKMQAKNGNEEYFLKKPQAFFDLSKEHFTNFNFQLRLKNAFTNTFLLAAKDSLETLKGYATGDVEVALFDNKAVFTIKEKFYIKDFRLTNPDGKSNVFKNSGFYLENSTVTINDDYSVDVDSRLLMANSNIKAKGKISEKGIDIAISDSKVDLQALGPIAGINITGSGPVDLRVTGPLDDVFFDFKVDWNNFSVVDLNFGRVKSEFSLALNDLELDIRSLIGVYNKSNFNAKGRLGFSDINEGMDLKIDFANTTFSDARKMYYLVFKNIKLPIVPEFDFEASYIVKGGFDLAKLKIDGQIKGVDLKIANEEAEKIALKFSLAKSIVNFRQIKINKARGELNANVNINLENNYIDMNGATQGLRLRDFNFYKRLSLEYDGDVFLDFDGSGTTSDFSSRFKTRVANAFIGNMPASSSTAIFYLNTNDVVTNASLLGGKVKVDSLISFKTNIAAIKSTIDTNDLKEFLGVFSGHNITDKGISGRIRAKLNTQISLGNLGVRKFLMEIDQLNLQKGNIALKIDPKFNNIEVDEGIVKNWDIRLRDGDDFFNSKGYNISNGVIGVNHNFSLKASLLEIATEHVERANGSVKGSTQIVFDKKISIKEFNLNGDDHSLKIKGLPGFITNFDYTIIKKGDSFEVVRMTGNYGEGEFKVGGKIFFDDLYPQINLIYQVDRSTIPLFKRSSVLISSGGTLTGTDLPYRLTGKVTFMHGEILEDPADLMKDNKVSIDEYKKYLPEKDLLGNRGYIDLNLSYDTANPVLIKNNMAEVYIKGNGQVTGDIQSPELNTRLEIVPNISKFKFKGHDFALNQGYVEIRDRGKNRISDLKFSGVARVSDYDMKLDLSGSISNVNIDLSSEPALSKEDLLSLLTLGVTSDMSKNLEAGERRFVTTVGIGTLLVDQLKINEDLNSSLGLKLSVQPEFKEDETTLIQGKSAVSEGSTSRLKSATKVKINKKINNKVDVSLSSTVGGSLEQKQEMNINFNINKNFSLEGVYEVKPTEDDNTNAPNSMGADLKWRKSF